MRFLALPPARAGPAPRGLGCRGFKLWFAYNQRDSAHNTMTQKILLIVHAPPYGSERCLSALRVAIALAGMDAPDTPELRVFLMSDATVLALPNQQDAGGKGLQAMVEELASRQVPLVVCRTCALARGLAELPLIPGARIGTLAELAKSTLWADKVITF
jgi:uncharacterized protein involved in oxidation of intracellular sulfur